MFIIIIITVIITLTITGTITIIMTIWLSHISIDGVQILKLQPLLKLTCHNYELLMLFQISGKRFQRRMALSEQKPFSV